MNISTDNFRLLHTMLRVMDLDKSIDFYTRHLGMKLLRRQDYQQGRFTLAFVGYGNEQTDTVVELTHNWDQLEPYTMGKAILTVNSPFLLINSLVPSRGSINQNRSHSFLSL